MKKVLLSAMLAAFSATAAQAAPITYTTVLNGANENPDIVTAGTGSATITYDSLTHVRLAGQREVAVGVVELTREVLVPAVE